MKKSFLVLAALFSLIAASGVSAQVFSATKMLGTVKLEFTSNLPQVVVAINGQAAGKIPLVVYVKPGQYVFTFTVPGSPPNDVPFKVVGDTLIPYNPVVRAFPLTVQVNVPNASIQIDGQPISSNPAAVLAGNHTLTVTAPGFAPSSQAFSMPSSPTTLNVNLQALSVPVSFNVNVAGATILIDGAPIVSNPAQVAPGLHQIQVTAPGYVAFAQTITVGPRALTVPVTLVPAQFPLTVRVNVPTASVAIDNVPVTRFPTLLAAGDHVLLVTAPGFQPTTLPFSMTAQPLQLNIDLLPALFPLTVDYNINVNGLSVSIDNKAVTLPASLPPGNHVLMVTAPGFQVFSLPFVMPNGALKLQANLVPELGTVSVRPDFWVPKANQKAIRVFVGNVEQANTPLLFQLPAGAYVIRLEFANLSVETQVTVQPGKTTVLTPRTVVDLAVENR